MSTATDPLAEARAALQRADWGLARARFEAAGDAPEALEGLARAAWWQGDEHATIAARERAYRAYRAAGDDCGAARTAMWLGSDHLDFRGDDALCAAWLRRARTHLAGHRACAEHGWLHLFEADMAATSDLRAALEHAERALEIARQVGDRDVEVVAQAIAGTALVGSGAVADGLARLDESAALAVGEDFADAAAPGWALCRTVSCCAGLGDFGRAEQWARALHGWSLDWRARQFFGMCRTAHGEVLASRGKWASAEEELASAVADLQATRPALAGPGAVRLGRLRARQGDEAGARDLFDRALPHPEAIVALGELALAAGDSEAAADAAERALRQLHGAGALERFTALELLACARASADTADEVAREAERLGTGYMRGRAHLVRARVLAAACDHDAARRAAEAAADCFAGCSAPYEAAQARLVLAGALVALGRPDRAEAESRAAREALAALGARPPAAAGELSPREVEILRLVAEGLSDAQIGERLFLSPHTVHRHVANIRARLRVPSRAAAVAHATRAGLL